MIAGGGPQGVQAGIVFGPVEDFHVGVQGVFQVAGQAGVASHMPANADHVQDEKGAMAPWHRWAEFLRRPMPRREAKPAAK